MQFCDDKLMKLKSLAFLPKCYKCNLYFYTLHQIKVMLEGQRNMRGLGRELYIFLINAIEMNCIIFNFFFPIYLKREKSYSAK